jgi:poly(beta-D-mannuronate) lyase
LRRLGRWLAVVAVGITACRATSPSLAHAPPTNAGTPAVVASVLRSPFDVEARRARVGVAMPDPRATPALDLAPVHDVNGVSFYTDEHKSVIDPALASQNLDALRPLRAFVKEITRLGDGWMISRPANARYAQLAVEALARWAAAGALLGEANQQGAYEREWTLGSLALAYLKVRDAPGVDPTARAAIDRWLCAVAALVEPPYERAGKTSSKNNHAYWTGLAVGAAGVACQDRSLFDWGIARARIGIAQVGPDGILPLELARQSRALHYHVFALAPLVMLAELATANGIALYDENDHALRRLADRVIAGLADPHSFERLTGVAQEQITTPPRGSDLAWAEPYQARFPDARLADWLAKGRPAVDVRLGGDLTSAFAVSAPSPYTPRPQ